MQNVCDQEIQEHCAEASALKGALAAAQQRVSGASTRQALRVRVGNISLSSDNVCVCVCVCVYVLNIFCSSHGEGWACTALVTVMRL